MGSFTEVSLSFDFQKDVPDYVLAAFSALSRADQPEGAPTLPVPVVEPGEFWDPEMRTTDWVDPYENELWRHDWASLVSLGMAPGVPHGLLTWDSDHWNLDCRFTWKSEPWTASDALAWLAPFVDTEWREEKLVGVAVFDGGPRPFLFWVRAGRWELEDLNPEDLWM
jgi:hypothetical protein